MLRKFIALLLFGLPFAATGCVPIQPAAPAASAPATTLTAVSYTHLTLPTKRIV